MAFTIFPNATRQPGEYTSTSVIVPDALKFIFWLDGLALVDEPPTFSIYWAIELSKNGGASWSIMHDATLYGGNVLYKDLYRIATTLDGVVGLLARGRMIVAGNSSKFGVQGELI